MTGLTRLILRHAARAKDNNRLQVGWRGQLIVGLLAILMLGMLGEVREAHAQSEDVQEGPFARLIGSQSPTAASLGKFGDIPVGLYRGTPDITIPLYEVEARTHSLPIELRYHASGVKVNEAASWVGQNWAMEAGGVITRTVRGFPDERPNGFLEWRDEMNAFLDIHGSERLPNKRFDKGSEFDRDDHKYMEKIYAPYGEGGVEADAEPDRFSFNVAGLSGQFVFHHDPGSEEQIVTTTRGEPVRIEYDVSDGDIQQWTLWGPDGTRYVFAQPEQSLVQTSSSQGTWGLVPVYSSWYLTAIYPSGSESDSIRFGYVSDYTIDGGQWVEYSIGTSKTTQTDPIGEETNDICPSPGDGSSKLYSFSTERRYKPQYLSYIKTDRVRIDFIPGPNYRTDIGGTRRLAEIQVKRNETHVKTFTFAHGYFNKGTDRERLRLDAVQEIGADGTAAEPYEFGYTSAAGLKGYGSESIDHWGFSNFGGEGLLPEVEHDGITYPGDNANRSPSGESKAGLLNEITYPTGGHTTLTYELHTYGSTLNGSGSGQAGGVRVKKIESDPGDSSPPVVKRYEYKEADGTSSGVLVAEPVYKRVVYYGEVEQADLTYIFARCPRLIREASSLAALGIGAGGHVAYRRVVVYTQEGETENRTVHIFGTGKGEREISDTGYPDIPRPNVKWNHGHKKQVSHYDGANRLLRRTTYEYDGTTRGENRSEHPTVEGLRVALAGEGLLPRVDGNGFEEVAGYIARKYTVQAGWRRLTQKKTTHYAEDETDSLTVTEGYEYDKDTYQVRTTTETTSNGLERRVEHTYAYEQESAMADSNMLVQRYSTTVRAGTDASGPVVEKEWTTWDNGWGNGVWRPNAEWVWIGDGTGNDTSIDDEPGEDTCDQDGEVICQTDYLDYTVYGQVLEQEDARGESTVFDYDPDRLFLEGASKEELDIEFAYYKTSDHQWGLLKSVTYPDGHIQSYDYDVFGRLVQVRDDRDSLVTTHQYYYQECGGESSDPGCVQTIAHGGLESPDVRTTEFVDGLGRAHQTRVGTGSDAVVTTQTYDAVGRAHKAYRPYLWGGTGYDSDFNDNASDYYQGLGVAGAGRPFSETLYKADPLDRVSKVYPPGESSAYAATDYDVGALGGTTYRYTEQTDEEGNRVRTYRDGFGRTVATVADPGGVGATTRFEYDLQDNLTKVTRPEGDAVTYTYDRTGRLLERDSPDAGRTEMKYDAAGNLRFEQDAEQAVRGEVRFTNYGALGRPLTSGVAPASFSDLDPDQAQGFESDTTYWRGVRAYDEAPDPQSYPWDRVDVASASVDSAEGRLAAEAYRSGVVVGQGLAIWQFVFYSYDSEGRVKTKHIYTEGDVFLDAKIDYAYDRQGRLTWRKVTVGGEEYVQRYDYNARGLVEAVYASTDDEHPIVPEFTYRYAADGQIETVDYRGSASPIEYAYTIRGWLKAIGEMDDPSGAFAARYGYYADGNVDTADYWQSGVNEGPQRYRYTHSYDGLDRLIGADYSYYDGSGWQESTAYDVPLVDYDSNGNLKTLERYGAGGTLIDDLSYIYGEEGAGPNQLTSLSDAAGANHSWDAGTGGFDYDKNGNLRIAPAPYDLVGAEYDESNRPVILQQTDGVSFYTYGVEGQRALKVEMSGCETPEGCSQIGTMYINDRGATLGVFKADDSESINFNLSYWNITLPSGEVIGRIPAQP